MGRDPGREPLGMGEKKTVILGVTERNRVDLKRVKNIPKLDIPKFGDLVKSS